MLPVLLVMGFSTHQSESRSFGIQFYFYVVVAALCVLILLLEWHFGVCLGGISMKAAISCENIFG